MYSLSLSLFLCICLSISLCPLSLSISLTYGVTGRLGATAIMSAQVPMAATWRAPPHAC